MASTEELLEAFAEWRTRSNANPRLTNMVRGWDRVIHFTTTDTGQGFTMRVQGQQLSDLTVGHEGQPDVVVTGGSDTGPRWRSDLTGMRKRSPGFTGRRKRALSIVMK